MARRRRGLFLGGVPVIGPAPDATLSQKAACCVSITLIGDQAIMTRNRSSCLSMSAGPLGTSRLTSPEIASDFVFARAFGLARPVFLRAGDLRLAAMETPLLCNPDNNHRGVMFQVVALSTPRGKAFLVTDAVSAPQLVELSPVRGTYAQRGGH